MTDGATVWLAIMATALVIMAVVQIGLIVVVLRVARDMGKAAEELRREVRPLLDKIHKIVDEAARATSLAATQVERVDELLAMTCTRLDQGITIVQQALGGPLRQAGAALMAFRAALSIFRGWQSRKRTGRDEEDALFVG